MKKYGVQRGGHETIPLRNTALELLHVALYNIQRELSAYMKRHIPCNSAFLDGLGVGTRTELNQVLDNHNRVFTITVLYGDSKYTYIALKPNCFTGTICSWVGDVRKRYIGYCSECCLSMGIFTVNNPVAMDVTEGIE